jgi:hypothetical protein
LFCTINWLWSASMQIRGGETGTFLAFCAQCCFWRSWATLCNIHECRTGICRCGCYKSLFGDIQSVTNVAWWIHVNVGKNVTGVHMQVVVFTCR